MVTTSQICNFASGHSLCCGEISEIGNRCDSIKECSTHRKCHAHMDCACVVVYILAQTKGDMKVKLFSWVRVNPDKTLDWFRRWSLSDQLQDQL